MTYDVPTLPSHLTPAPATPSALPILTGSLGYKGSRFSNPTLNRNSSTLPFMVHLTTTLTVTEVDLSTFTSVTVVGPSVPRASLEIEVIADCCTINIHASKISGNGLEHLDTTSGRREFSQRSEIYTSSGGRQEREGILQLSFSGALCIIVVDRPKTIEHQMYRQRPYSTGSPFDLDGNLRNGTLSAVARADTWPLGMVLKLLVPVLVVCIKGNVLGLAESDGIAGISCCLTLLPPATIFAQGLLPLPVPILHPYP
ncbi:hypothetical protein C7212DRAFT_344980 [Tuber magnatum]|uniref:Uncharacterized protein n=1 Tax=Tuber magnatum TaxID=42249 RepID=A0A317SKZ6_9PEZI|nr:hypothetical protein C7212DRAFT_344980 [Tuber magnatum]